MTEKFENRRLFGKINVACKYDNSPTRYWVDKKENVVQRIIDIIAEYKKDNYILSLRQLHYQFVINNWIINHDTAYKKLGTILDDCRYGGVIDWNAIEDRGRVPYLQYAVENIEDALNDTLSQYKIDRQRNQQIVIELWSEKDALSNILRRSTDKYHIRLVINKGYSSSTAMYNAYKRILENMSFGRTTVILYFGDHDPSGLDMVRDIQERLIFMIRNGSHAGIFVGIENSDDEFPLLVIPIGLTMEQVKHYKLPPNPTKMTDTRSDKYINLYGPTCWEVDALNPRILTRLIENTVENIIDIDRYIELLELEQKEKQDLETIIDSHKNNNDE